MKYNLISEVLYDGQKITGIEIFGISYLEYKSYKIHAKHYDEGNLVIDEDVKVLKVEGKEDHILLKIKPIFLISWHNDISTNHKLLPEYQVYINNEKCEFNKVINLLVDDFDFGSSFDINYRLFKPKDNQIKHPLIIWIHGAGEGGLTNDTQITGNQGGVAFVRDNIQKLFNGAYVLAPQSKTFWMEKFDNGIKILDGQDQTKELIQLIKKIIKEYNIDDKRVYIGGCSMGGYETFKVIIEEPSLFAFAFPICAAYKPTLKELEKIKNLPIWMTHAKADESVPYESSLSTYNNLKKLKANVHLSTFETVEVDGIHYLDHFSWIYALNNMCIDEDGHEFIEYMSHFSNKY